MNPHIFVYGTLLSADAHPKGERLRTEARLVGEASIAGRLYRIKHYPGLVEASDQGALVHGEIYALNAPATSLQWLDTYEGIAPGHEATAQYMRTERNARLTSGEDILAWVYLYQWDVAGRELITDGRWPSSRAGQR